MKISDLLGAVMQSGMSPSSNARMRNSIGGGDVLGSLAGMFGGTSAGRPEGPLSGLSGGGSPGGLGGLLGNILGEAEHAVGGKQNLALGGLGALAGALLGGGRRSVGGAMGGGVMALLGAIAFQALKGRGDQKPRVPLMYGASLLAIEVDTPAEKSYLDQLAAGLGLHPEVTQRIKEAVSLQPA